MTRWTEQEFSAFISRAQRSQARAFEHMKKFVVSEKDFQVQIESLLAWSGWRYYHTWNSKNSNKGFPDVVALRRDRRLVAELKREGKEPTPEQLLWLHDFKEAGFETYIWRPQDIEEITEVLK